ncbi:tRNA (N(6)-L-threonylcarbamoyladenosine(37)-C(2))-methylthiotransferase MtaB [Salinispira pacifica]
MNAPMKSANGRRIAFQTLGCKLNQYETDSLASRFVRAGYRVVPFGSPADACVVNTCTVTNRSDRKSRNTINRALRGGLPEGRSVPGETGEPLVVVTGCFVGTHRDELESMGLNYVVENDQKSHIFELVDAHFRGEMEHPVEMGRDLFDFPVAEQIFHTRSMVKIQDGCDNFCTFCIIPYVRGRAASRPVQQILDNVRETVEAGSREVVITGVNLSRYRDGETGFSSLLEQILEVPGDFRVRISSMEPDSLDERFLDILGHPKMCPHLHLCLQSGSERVLLQMRRQYTYREYRRITDSIRARYPDFNLTTDVIVGFPGESEEDFAQTERACREIGFSHIHTFPYSRRTGTRAERMDGHLSEQVKKERSARIRAISDLNKRRYREQFVGRSQRLLVERVGARGAEGSGYGEHYVPVELRMPQVRHNEFYDVTLTALTDGEDPTLIALPAATPAVALR